MRYKVCPNCGAQNKPEELLCVSCMADLSGAPVSHGVDATVVQTQESLLVLEGEGFRLELRSGQEYVLGRQAFGSEYFSKNPYVSRRHAKVYYRNGSWYIEDLNSTNGLYVNGSKVEKAVLREGDEVSLSTSMKLRVIRVSI